MTRPSTRPESVLDQYSQQLRLGVLRRNRIHAEKIARLESEKAVAVKARFIAMMSHELRTPLNAIIGFSEMLAKSPGPDLDPAQIREFAEYITASSRNLLGLLNDILEVSKLQSNFVALNPEDIDVGELVAVCLQPFRREAEAARVALLTELSPDAASLVVDQAKICKALSGLVANGIRYNRPGGSVTVSSAIPAEGKLALTVADTGFGMDAEEIEIALTPFGRADPSYATRVNGLGLGLTIARALTELHGGTLSLESRKGEGTAVTLTFAHAAPARLEPSA